MKFFLKKVAKNLVEPNKSCTFALAIQKWLLRLQMVS